MAMRSLTMRLAPRLRLAQSRSASGGGVLGEEEKAAENIYIKRMEKERMEKLEKAAREGAKDGRPLAEEPAPGTPQTEEEASAAKTKFIAIVAGFVGLGSCVYWYATRESATKKEEA